LLDAYTITRTFDFDENSIQKDSRLTQLRAKYPDLTSGMDNKTYAFCGDIGRGRTVRSLASVLSQYSNVTMFFVSPDEAALRLDDRLKQRLLKTGVQVVEFDSLDATHNGQPLLSQIDCMYMTRIQREHNSESTEAKLAAMDLSPFQLNTQRVARMKDYAPILHPFPRDSVVDEIPPAVDSDPRAMYFRQARNGMWIRAALLVHLFDAADSLFMAYSDVISE